MGYHHVRLEERIGDAAAFERAIAGLRTWVAHEGAGLRIHPHEPFAPDATVIVVTTIGPLRLVAPCRIVSVFKDPDAFGFAYGTLPGHPERGEESFASNGAMARRTSPSVRSRSWSTCWPGWGPVGRVVQRSMTRRYVSALRRFVDRPR